MQLAHSYPQTRLLPAQTPLNVPTSALLTSSLHKEVQKKNSGFYSSLYCCNTFEAMFIKFKILYSISIISTHIGRLPSTQQHKEFKAQKISR